MKKIHIVLLTLSVLTFLWSSINPLDRESWFLLSLPAIILVISLILTFKKFRFSTFVYIVLYFHVVILLVGAKYTYTANPLFDILNSMFDLGRNHFDRVGHFAQGLTPVLMAKEVLLRSVKMKRDLMFYYIILSIAMGFSAFYELCEFSASFFTDMPGEIILGLQGDVFDTQKDILMAFIGALTAIFIVGPFHDKRIREFEDS